MYLTFCLSKYFCWYHDKCKNTLITSWTKGIMTRNLLLIVFVESVFFVRMTFLVTFDQNLLLVSAKIRWNSLIKTWQSAENSFLWHFFLCNATCQCRFTNNVSLLFPLQAIFKLSFLEVYLIFNAESWSLILDFSRRQNTPKR